MIPVVSSSYKWTLLQVAGRADITVYKLLENELRNEVNAHTHQPQLLNEI